MSGKHEAEVRPPDWVPIEPGTKVTITWPCGLGCQTWYIAGQDVGTMTHDHNHRTLRVFR